MSDWAERESVMTENENNVQDEELPVISEEVRKRIQEFCLIDDEYMTAFFDERPDCVELILRIILGRNDLVVDNVKVQHLIKNLQGRSIQLDIHSRTTMEEFNVEIQKDPERANPKRLRYHGSILDANTINPGDEFENLPETYVIFITGTDYYGKGKPIYHVERFVIDDDGGQLFNDELHIMYVNGAYEGDDDIGKLMHDFRCQEPDDMNYQLIKDRATYLKKTEKGVRHMSDVMQSYVNEEVHKRSLNIAKQMLVDGKLTYDEVAEYFGLTMDEVEELAGKKSA